ncbi:MAG TPA: XRE family transcriptional regulator [Bryobacteraceae bacterium]|nr:XRE family transcriptional regulator [Bryobacteraceae bacterium]
MKNTESSEETIRRVLSSYDIGPKLRRLRLRKKIALVDLGKHTGLSASMLSQLENGKLIPTLPTLARIAMVFDVGLDHFFADKSSKRTFSIVRAGERLRFPELPDSAFPTYFFEVLIFGSMQKAMSAYIVEFPRREPKDIHEHFHDGSEFVHVLEGTLAINYQSEEHVLGAGDSVYFDGSEPHSYCGLSDSPARAIVITVPLRL